MKSATVVESPNPNWVGLSIENNIQSIDVCNLDLSAVDVTVGKDSSFKYVNFYTRILNPTLYNGKKYYNLNLFEQFYCAAVRGYAKLANPFRIKLRSRLVEYFKMEDVRKFTFKEYAELLSSKPLGAPVQIGFEGVGNLCKNRDLYKGLSMPDDKSLEELEKEVKTIGYYDITDYFVAPILREANTHHCTDKNVCRSVNGYFIYLVPEDLFFKDFKSDYVQVKDKEVQLSLAMSNKKTFPFMPTVYKKPIRSHESKMPVRLSGPRDVVGDKKKFTEAPLFSRNYLTTPTVHEGSMMEERKLFWCMVTAIERCRALDGAIEIKLWSSSSWKTKEIKGKNKITSFDVRLAPRNALYLRGSSKMQDIKTKVSENFELKKLSEEQLKWIVRWDANGQISPFVYLRYNEKSFELCDMFEIPEEFANKSDTIQRCKFDNASSLKDNEDYEKYANKFDLAQGCKSAAYCNLFTHRMILIPRVTMSSKDNSCSMRFVVSHMWSSIMPERDTSSDDVEEDYSAYEEVAKIEQLKIEEGVVDDVSEDEDEVDYDEDSFESS